MSRKVCTNKSSMFLMSFEKKPMAFHPSFLWFVLIGRRESPLAQPTCDRAACSGRTQAAADCSMLAKTTTDPGTRTTLSVMTQQWIDLEGSGANRYVDNVSRAHDDRRRAGQACRTRLSAEALLHT